MATSRQVFTAQDGVIWVQTGGPNTAPALLGCHEIGDIAEPQGDTTYIYCPHPYRRGEYEIVGQTKSPPGAKTFSLTARTYKTAGYLERLKCPINVFVLQSECADKRLFAGGYERIKVLYEATLTEKGESGLASIEGTDPATQTFGFSFAEAEELYPVDLGRQAIAATEDILDIAFLDLSQCLGACGPKIDEGTYGIVALKAAAGAQKPWLTLNGGASWAAAAAAAPFAAAKDISAAAIVRLGQNDRRWLVANGTTTGATAAQVAYSDDDGTTFTLVSVGAADGSFFPHRNSLFALDYYHIWAGTDTGAVYFSEDGGASWTLQLTAATDANAFHFVDEETGLLGTDGGNVYFTSDGGANWSTVTGGHGVVAINAVVCHDNYNWWTAFADGQLWYTVNGGDTWAQRSFSVPGYTVTSITDLKFLGGNPRVGFMTGRCTSGGGAVIHGYVGRTFDGGYTWEFEVTPALDAGALGLNAVEVINANLAFAAGDLLAATPTIYTLSD